MPPTLYSILTFGRHFGTGVILATAFIHMLPGSMSAFADPCASSFSNLYGSWGTLFAMIAALLMQLIEFLAGEMARSTTKGTLPPPGPSDTSSSDAHDRCSKDAVVLDTSTCKVVESGIPVHHHMGHSCHDPATMMDQGGRRISTYILELGIAIHSVLIGLALGTAGSDEFVALLVALVFHQFFEGVALGSRIGEVVKRHHLGRMLFMAATFALVTPLGTAIGIGIRSSYAPRSPTTLITQGVLDGLSAGVLIYTAFVSLMAEEFIHNEHFRSQNRRAKASAFTALYLGAALMALIGKWA
ncbi:MAG: Zinc/iron permease [Piptocephalis tieghemiana]|nr:MAG: Zinc/iron permease [Piptocephalis tieghemiana]